MDFMTDMTFKSGLIIDMVTLPGAFIIDKTSFYQRAYL